MCTLTGNREIIKYMNSRGVTRSNPLRLLERRDGYYVFMDIVTGNTMEVRAWRLGYLEKIEGDIYRALTIKGRLRIVKDESIPSKGKQEA